MSTQESHCFGMKSVLIRGYLVKRPVEERARLVHRPRQFALPSVGGLHHRYVWNDAA